MTSAFAETEQKKRDLRTQIAGLDQGELEKEATIEEWSPGRKLIKLWSMLDGDEITIPRYMVGAALMKFIPGTRNYAFTAYKEEAPTFREGNVRCFLAEDSQERLSGILSEAGLDHLPPCPAKSLRSAFSKRVHGEHRHVQSWTILQEYLADQSKEEDRAEQRQQTAAMLQLAGARSEEATGEFICEECGKPAKSELGLRLHMRSHNKS